MYVTLSDTFAAGNCIDAAATAGEIAGDHQTGRRTKLGQTLFNEGDDAMYLYEVVTGVVRLSRVTVSGRRQVIAFGFPGDVLGFPSRGFYHADCDVIEAGEVALHSTRILDACTDNPRLHRYMVNAALAEISGMQDHFLMLGRKSAGEKTAAFLDVLASRIGTVTEEGTRIVLPMCRSDIADFLGLSNETVSRTFSQLRANGIIELPIAQEVVVPDRKALQDLSERD